MNNTEFDYVTHTEFQAAIKDLKTEIYLSESRISERLSNRINDTYWKLIPIVLGLMTVVNGVFYLAYKIG